MMHHTGYHVELALPVHILGSASARLRDRLFLEPRWQGHAVARDDGDAAARSDGVKTENAVGALMLMLMLDAAADAATSGLALSSSGHVGRFRVLVQSVFRWGVAPQGEVEPSGDPEGGTVLDAIGQPMLQVAVYRAKMAHLVAASIMVPEPEPGWHAR